VSERVNYTDQLRKRADRATALEREVEALRARLAALSDEANLHRMLKAIVDSAPACQADWSRPKAPLPFTVEKWEWNEDEGRTPEHFEAAVYEAFRFLYPGLLDDTATGGRS
jgi:ribosomal protein S10